MTNTTRVVIHKLLGPVLAVAGFCSCTLTNAHDGNLNEKPWLVCKERRLDDSCAYENSANDVYRGTCQSIQAHLMCVRNQPIEKAGSSASPDTRSEQEQPTLRDAPTLNDTGLSPPDSKLSE